MSDSTMTISEARDYLGLKSRQAVYQAWQRGSITGKPVKGAGGRTLEVALDRMSVAMYAASEQRRKYGKASKEQM